MKPFDEFSAVLAPKRTDDLRPGVADWIGKRLRVRYTGEVDHKCEYTGQPRFDVLTPLAPMGWVPGCDLADLQPA